MSKESLFKHIRHEDVVIWAGAGLSRYAGYPLGNELRQIIYNELSPDEKAGINPETYSLAAMAKEFVRFKLNSTNELLRILKGIYDKAPVDMSLHQQLAKTPHFKTAITTNYDNLFELAYQGHVNKIVQDSDIALREKKNFNVVKFHGDLSVPKSIIISEPDYARLYNADHGSPLRSFVTEQLSSQVVLFLGYGYEDPNVWALFDKVNGYLSGVKKQAFFVAPGLPQQKVTSLIQAGIDYIDSTAELFLSELLVNIKANIMEDFRKGHVSPETYRQFLNYYNIEPGLNGTINGFQLKSISSVDKGPLKSGFTLNVPNNEALVKKIDDFFLHNDSEELELDSDNIHAAHINVEGIAMNDPAIPFVSINFKKLPSIVYDFNLVFFKENFELNNLKAAFFKSFRKSIVKVKVHNLHVKLIITYESDHILIRLEYRHDSVYSNTREELEVYRFLQLAFSESEATIMFHNGSSFPHAGVYNENEINRAQAYIDYLEKLKILEQHFKVKFQNFAEPTKATENTLDNLIKIINHEAFEMETTETVDMKFEAINAENIAVLETFNHEHKALRFAYDNDEEFPLHGHIFTFPRKQIVIPSAEITNMEEIREGKTNTIKVLSRTGVIQEQYLLKDDRLE